MAFGGGYRIPTAVSRLAAGQRGGWWLQGVGGTWVLTEHGLGSSRRTWLGLDGCRSATVSGRGDWEELPVSLPASRAEPD